MGQNSMISFLWQGFSFALQNELDLVYVFCHFTIISAKILDVYDNKIGTSFFERIVARSLLLYTGTSFFTFLINNSVLFCFISCVLLQPIIKIIEKNKVFSYDKNVTELLVLV
jgi:hypothetical protein